MNANLYKLFGGVFCNVDILGENMKSTKVKDFCDDTYSINECEVPDITQLKTLRRWIDDPDKKPCLTNGQIKLINKSTQLCKKMKNNYSDEIEICAYPDAFCSRKNKKEDCITPDKLISDKLKKIYDSPSPKQTDIFDDYDLSLDTLFSESENDNSMQISINKDNHNFEKKQAQMSSRKNIPEPVPTAKQNTSIQTNKQTASWISKAMTTIKTADAQTQAISIVALVGGPSIILGSFSIFCFVIILCCCLCSYMLLGKQKNKKK